VKFWNVSTGETIPLVGTIQEQKKFFVTVVNKRGGEG